MAIKPILFNTKMVMAILDGRKTQTRRLVKPHYHDGDAGFNVITMADTGAFCYIEYYDEDERSTERRLNPPYNIGDILWVRETWTEDDRNFYYRADFESDWLDPCETLSGGYPIYCRYHPECEGCTREKQRIYWHPSIHMPKEAARIFLRVTDVRAERLWKITEEDAMAEGATHEPPFSACPYIRGFAADWERTLRPEQEKNFGWAANPWVWVISFERTEQQTPFYKRADRDFSQSALYRQNEDRQAELLPF